MFDYCHEVCDYVNDSYNKVNRVVSVCPCEVNGVHKFILFYTKIE